jgi:hypothetical protein
VYAATPTFSTLKLILAHALNNDFSMYIGDVSTAFLHASVIQPTYVSPPEDYQTDSKENVVWKLKRAMYGLKSAPKSWQEHLKEVLQEMGLQQMKSDSCLFSSADRQVYVIVYVDDLFIAGHTKVMVIKIIAAVRQKALLGTPLHYLGREVTHHGNSVSVWVGNDYIR